MQIFRNKLKCSITQIFYFNKNIECHHFKIDLLSNKVCQENKLCFKEKLY